jgi:hypothetical protein
VHHPFKLFQTGTLSMASSRASHYSKLPKLNETKKAPGKEFKQESILESTGGHCKSGNGDNPHGYTVWRPTSVLQYYAANYSSERITRLCLFHRTNNPLHLKVPQFEDHLNGRITSPIPSDRIRNVQSELTTSLPEPINDSKLRHLKGDHHPHRAPQKATRN